MKLIKLLFRLYQASVSIPLLQVKLAIHTFVEGCKKCNTVVDHKWNRVSVTYRVELVFIWKEGNDWNLRIAELIMIT